MTRPIKIYHDTKKYHLTVPIKDFDELSKFSKLLSDRHGMQVSVADLMRTAITLYIEDLRKEEKDFVSQTQ